MSAAHLLAAGYEVGTGRLVPSVAAFIALTAVAKRLMPGKAACSAVVIHAVRRSPLRWVDSSADAHHTICARAEFGVVSREE